MPQITHNSDEPFVFAYGGRTYIVPPKHGGKWGVVYEPYVDDNGFSKSRRVVQQTGESARNFIDVPDGAVIHLSSAKMRKRHKNKISVVSDVITQVEHELKDLKADRIKLEEEKRELAEKLAALEAAPAKKAPRAKG